MTQYHMTIVTVNVNHYTEWFIFNKGIYIDTHSLNIVMETGCIGRADPHPNYWNKYMLK